jgi:hypothetical protein
MKFCFLFGESKDREKGFLSLEESREVMMLGEELIRN